jgi:hypothetical protein
MKLFVTIFLLGACLNMALAQEPEITQESQAEEATEPKFSNLVKSTMDMLGPSDEEEEVTLSQEVDTQNLSQTE